MAIESNIESYYEELVASIAERALDSIKDGVEDESEAIWREIDSGLMYYVDQGYLVAHAVVNGLIKLGEKVEWDTVYEDLCQDVQNDIELLKKEQENDA